MGVSTTHPDYVQHLSEWETMRDAIDDEVMRKGTTYLPMTDGMAHLATTAPALAEGIYKSYRDRSMYPLWVKDAIRAMMGLVSRVTPVVSLPTRIAGLEQNATADGFNLIQLFRRVVREQLITGRSPMLVDVDADGVPYIALYAAESAINWKQRDMNGRQDLSLVVLTESRDTSTDEYGHENETVYRVLRVEDGRYIVSVLDDAGNSMVLDDAGNATKEPIEPRDGRDKNLTYIPLVFCGSTDNSPGIDEVPLLTMAKAAIKYYQLSADYYESLHRTAHPQAWVATSDEVKFETTGPATIWNLGSTEADIGYLEISGKGIEATYTAREEQRNAAMEAGARVMDVGGTESGEARKARMSDQTATLSSVVMTAASAIQQCLEMAAEMVGADPSEVSFEVEPDFMVNVLDPQILTSLQNAAMAGLVSNDTYWTYVSTGKIPERSWDEEVEHIETQAPGLNA